MPVFKPHRIVQSVSFKRKEHGKNQTLEITNSGGAAVIHNSGGRIYQHNHQSYIPHTWTWKDQSHKKLHLQFVTSQRKQQTC